MKRKFTFLIAAAFMLLTMMASTGTMWGQSTYTKVTTAQSDWTGTYVIVADASNVIFTGQSGSNNYGGYAAVTISNNSVTGDFSNYEVEIEKSGDYYTMKHSSSTKYLGWTSGNYLYFSTSTPTANSYKWSLSTSAILNASDTNRKLQYNSGSPRFACYTSSQKVAYLYKKETGGDAPTITADPVSIGYNETSGSITYTIDPSTGASITNAVVTTSNPAGWLTVSSPFTSPIALTCEANATPSAKTAIVTLTCTYGSNQTTTKTVSVTQEGNPNASGGANNPYSVAEAFAAVDAGTGITGVYATGIVSEIVSEYSTTYHNITFNMVDESGDQVFLQAFRCVGDEAPDVTVGYIAVVTGNLTKYNDTYEFAQGCTLVSLTPPATPYITANDVEITYDTDADEIEYTINNPVSGGVLTASTTSEWLSVGTVGATVPFTCSVNSAAASRTATVTLTYTYNTNQTVTKDVTVTQAGNPDYTMTIAEVRALATGTTVTTKGIVTSITENSGKKTAYMQDNTAGIVVYGAFTTDVVVGDEIRVEGELTAYKDLVEIGTSNNAPTVTVLSQNNTVTPVVKTIAEIDINIQAMLIRVENATVTEINGANTTIAQGTNTIVVRNLSGVVVNNVISLTANVGWYDAAQLVNPTDVQVAAVPSITLPEYTLPVGCDGGNTKIKVSYENLAASPNLTTVFYESDGVTEASYGWIQGPIVNDSINGHIDVNTGDARSAYFKVKGRDTSNNWAYSDLVTVNQAAYSLSISFETPSIDLDAGGESDRKMSFDYSGLGSNPTFEVRCYESDGTTAATYDWLTTSINKNKVNITVDANTGDARTAYFKVYGSGSIAHTESNLVTVNQAGGTTPPVGNNYVKVTSSNDLTDGQYLIVYEEGGLAFDGSLETLDKANNTIAVTISNNEIAVTSETAASEFTIASISDGYSIQSASGYYIGQTSDANGMKTSETEVYTNTISIDTDGNANVKASGGAYMRYNATSGQERFRYFKSSTYTNQNAIQLYKKAEGPSTPSITANNVNIAYNVTEGAIEYTINNPVEGGSMSAQVTTGGDWPLAISSISATSVNFTIPENESAQERTGVIRLTYTYGRATETKDVNVTQAAAPQNYNLTVEPFENLELITFVDDEMELEGDGTIQVTSGSQVMLSIVADEGYVIETLMVNGVDHAGDIDDESTYTFTMPYEAVTISATAAEAPTPGQYIWVLTDLEDLTSDDVFVIVGNNNKTYAMSNENGTTAAPTAVAVTIVNNTLSGEPDDNIKWNISGNADGYTFYPDGSTTTWLYCTNTNNGVRVGGTNNDKTFVLDDESGYLKHNGTSRYVGIYSSQDWRCYTSTTTNIQGQTFAFYKRVPAPTDPSITLSSYSIEATAEGDINTLTATYNNIDEVIADVEYYESDGETVTTYDWFVAEINSENNTIVDYVIDENEGIARTAYFKVYALVGDDFIYSDLVTVSQAAQPTASYSLVTNVNQIVSGKHYLITSSGTNGAAYAMGAQTGNNRSGVEITIAYDQIADPEGVCEFVINTNGVNSNDEVIYTIYDAETPGYLYAAGSGSGKNYLRTENTLDNNGRWTIAIAAEGSAASIIAQGSNTNNNMKFNSTSALFSCYASGQSAIYLYVKDNDNNLEYYGTEITYPGTSIPDGGSITVGSGSVITVPNGFTNNSPDNILIEEGGQLIHESDVAATVQKNVAAYTARDGDGWYLIATPVETIDKSVVAGTNYDLFLYSEPDAMWYAHWDNPGFEELYRGQGYLYANAADKIINYAGTMKATNANINIDLDYTSTLSDAVRGFNLVGNPFTCNLKLGDMKLGGANLTTYYVTNTDRTALQAITSDAYQIKPGEGFFVQATAASQQLSFNASSKDDIDFRYIKIVAGNENGYDNAYIQMGDCNTLRKMNIANKTEVYVMDGEDDYAAARVEELAGSMPVHFKAIADGEYTITIEAKYTDVYYMHLFDNFTGEDIDLMLEPSYTFHAAAEDAENRFLLVFDFNNHLSVNENYINDVFAYQYGDEIIINGEGELQIFDVMGRMVLNTKVNGVQSFNVPSNGVYILRIIGNDIKTQKIVVK